MATSVALIVPVFELFTVDVTAKGILAYCSFVPEQRYVEDLRL